MYINDSIIYHDIFKRKYHDIFHMFDIFKISTFIIIIYLLF